MTTDNLAQAIALRIAQALVLQACQTVSTEAGCNALAHTLREYATWLDVGAFETPATNTIKGKSLG